MDAHALIIDDNQTNIEVMGELLLACGVSYSSVTDVADLDIALEDLDQLDVIFLDLEMPRADGYVVLEMLRNEMGVRVPIVASTVHLNEIQTAREMGFDGFLGKPLKLSRFSDQLERILDGEQVWDA